MNLSLRLSKDSRLGLVVEGPFCKSDIRAFSPSTPADTVDGICGCMALGSMTPPPEVFSYFDLSRPGTTAKVSRASRLDPHSHLFLQLMIPSL